VDSTLPADNQPTTCTENLDEGWTYAINFLTGLPIPQFFTQYNTTTTVGFRFDATGTPSELTTGTTDGYIFQTASGTPLWKPKKPPAPNAAHRLTWIQLR
jgi:hypothetical protein